MRVKNVQVGKFGGMHFRLAFDNGYIVSLCGGTHESGTQPNEKYNTYSDADMAILKVVSGDINDLCHHKVEYCNETFIAECRDLLGNFHYDDLSCSIVCATSEQIVLAMNWAMKQKS